VEPVSAELDAVSKSKQAYVIAKTTLEQRLRLQMKSELSNLHTQIDIAVRFAHNSGESKAAILRALGTSDYHTVSKSLGRTEAVAQIVGANPLDSCYTFETEYGVLSVTYLNHGPLTVNGSARFEYKEFDDGVKMFMAITPLWNGDFTKRNDVVAVLDGVKEGFYYEEAIMWMRGRDW